MEHCSILVLNFITMENFGWFYIFDEEQETHKIDKEVTSIDIAVGIAKKHARDYNRTVILKFIENNKSESHAVFTANWKTLYL